MKDIDADYYGYRDEDDGMMTPMEQEMEKKGKNTFVQVELFTSHHHPDQIH